MIIKVRGILEFEPQNKTRKHEEQASWKRVALIKTGDDLSEYYSWFIRKRFNLELNKPLRGAHVTIVNDAERDFEFGVTPIWQEAVKEFDGKPMDFYIDPEPVTNGEHWWLRVYCPDAESLRGAMGLTPEPFFNLHLTLGYANSRWIEHSKYILEVSKIHGIISHPKRLPMDMHEIITFT
jgi:hypothetical protein